MTIEEINMETPPPGIEQEDQLARRLIYDPNDMEATPTNLKIIKRSMARAITELDQKREELAKIQKRDELLREAEKLRQELEGEKSKESTITITTNRREQPTGQ